MSKILQKTINFFAFTKNTNIFNSKRLFSLENTTASRLIYLQYGDPTMVIEKTTFPLKKPTDNEVLIKILAAPINPADINTIQGKYPAKPATLPAVPGNEGVGEVVMLGDNVKGLSIGDRVIPLVNMLGTWQTHMTIDEKQALVVPNSLGLVEASTLSVNPCTAYRMLKDFAILKANDVIIQNGANSACGQYVIQLCRNWGLKSVNIVRSRPEIIALKDQLFELGATHVLTEEELRTTEIFRSKEVARPKLGLNCVGGKSSLELLRHLEKGASMVTYGGMSREPVTVPTSALIFKDIQVRGYWMTEWVKKNSESKARRDMLNELVQLMISGKLVGPVSKLIDFENYKEAIAKSVNPEGKSGQKYILHFK